MKFSSCALMLLQRGASVDDSIVISKKIPDWKMYHNKKLVWTWKPERLEPQHEIEKYVIYQVSRRKLLLFIHLLFSDITVQFCYDNYYYISVTSLLNMRTFYAYKSLKFNFMIYKVQSIKYLIQNLSHSLNFVSDITHLISS